MTIVRTPIPHIFEKTANEFLRNGIDGLVVIVNPFVCVWSGQLPLYHAEHCRERNIPVLFGEYLGGCIVNMPGDLSLARTTWGDSDYGERVTAAATVWLKDRGVAVCRDGNDVLADGKKVASWAKAISENGWCQSVVHFSVGTMDLELIKSICLKPMEKIPGSLGDYGIKAEDIWDVVKDIA